jgi:hypothetical protein
MRVGQYTMPQHSTAQLTQCEPRGRLRLVGQFTPAVRCLPLLSPRCCSMHCQCQHHPTPHPSAGAAEAQTQRDTRGSGQLGAAGVQEMVSQWWLDHARFCTCADCCFNRWNSKAKRVCKHPNAHITLPACTDETYVLMKPMPPHKQSLPCTPPLLLCC